ncbi:right-handed parallel beta-helix repeat-containing protein [Polaribacter septentrionalilitoris]|uniref:hypothetical protein n=1 Tax=Polaribacter septentrionalilitoris TaxID=2494657 RepID=UPI0013577537|nr:hypothetical protein [Polaribacter septentrionalilitoris]
MKKKTLIKKVICTAVFACSLVLNAQISVDNKVDTNAMYSNLQEAVNAANTGDTIYVHSSTIRYGNVAIDKKIVLLGRTPRTNSAQIQGIEIKLSGSGTIIKGLRISSISTTFATNLLIENNWITSGISFGNPTTTNRIATIRGNFISSIFNPRKTLITNNYITGSINSIQEVNTTIITNNLFPVGVGIYNADNANGKKALVQNCMFLGRSTSPLTQRFDNLNLTNCLFFNYGGATFEVNESGSSNSSFSDILENTNPQFTKFNDADFADITNDFTLRTGSPAISAGLNNQQIGIMGNGYTYRATLHPFGIPTIQIVSSTGEVPENGTLKVTFTGKSN